MKWETIGPGCWALVNEAGEILAEVCAAYPPGTWVFGDLRFTSREAAQLAAESTLKTKKTVGATMTHPVRFVQLVAFRDGLLALDDTGRMWHGAVTFDVPRRIVWSLVALPLMDQG